jgi:hypothetical protein
VKGKYTDKGLNFITSAEAHFALGVIFSPNPGTLAGKRGLATNPRQLFQVSHP